ncbi:hypothetical protein AQF52_3008 [Streptomyces venezuelae]|uniref:hypothetical protein n=1 Tax=Streptomyces gardneri TaxID=66892 RepID=UPI0006BD6F7B|nr:hypothetical protein [Streptomyces gardneri]ALO08602.1 hypothetical protein AQF52_3008 [Streptomyces venezuelae]QPK50983.1 hypothetical protein H4W23_14915 [Streptomyces gardneri]WRK37150.1 hypothetical protein U0M97_14985 [Streptomyces venezuelae]CUM41025.1 hypothetical protein BN2537_11015 [Streptomyces venezuelae]
MPAPSTTAGQTSTGSTPAPVPALGSPRGRRRAPVTPVAPAGPSAGPDREWGTGAGAGTADAAGDVVRWAVFCCVLVPVVLVVYGTSLGGAAGTALGLVTVTAVCRVLLRRSERGLRAETARTRRRN